MKMADSLTHLLSGVKGKFQNHVVTHPKGHKKQRDLSEEDSGGCVSFLYTSNSFAILFACSGKNYISSGEWS